MKVLHIAASLDPERGGPTKVIIELTGALKEKGIDVTIFAPTNNIKTADTYTLNNVTIKTFPTSIISKIWPYHSPCFTKTLKREISDFDLIHIHEIWHHPEFICYKTAIKKQIPYLITVHGSLDPPCLHYKTGKKKIYTTLIQKQIFRKAAALHATNKNELENITAYIDNKNIFCVPNGLNVGDYENLPDKSELGNMYNQIKGKKTILFLGRIHPKKGLDILAEAFANITRKRNDVCLLIVGPDNDNYKRKIEKILSNKNVHDKVIFTGTLTGEKKLATLSGSDVFVLPSHSEGFGMSILEAMICGLPVVISKECHFPEIAKAQAGRIIECDAEELSETIIELLNNPELCRRMGISGKKLVKDKYTWDKAANKMIQQYEEILKYHASTGIQAK